jgi:hypothetical protein
MTNFIMFVCISISSLLLAAGFFLESMVALAGAAILIGLVWAYAAFRRWTWVYSLTWVLLVLGCGAGSILRLSPVLLLICVVFSLAAWDLSLFNRRLEAGPGVEKSSLLEKRHLSHIAFLGGAGLLLGIIPLFLQFSLSFIWAVVLAVAVLFALNRVLAYLGERGR